VRNKELFLNGEAFNWLERNKRVLHNRRADADCVLDCITRAAIHPLDVLEIGSADGRRLNAIARAYHCSTHGIDPLIGSTADDLSRHGRNAFDLVIYGFCLYVTDPQDWFQIVAEADRVLRVNGHVIIHDFYAERYEARPYKHDERITSHHYPFERLWLSHPAYTLISRQVIADGEQCLTVLRKSLPSSELQPKRQSAASETKSPTLATAAANSLSPEQATTSPAHTT
jgi:SAM-dependent methyltransferase